MRNYTKHNFKAQLGFKWALKSTLPFGAYGHKSVDNRVIKWEDIIIFKLRTYLKTPKSHREFELSTKFKYLYFIIICVNN